MHDENIYELILVHETEAAILVSNGDTQVWLPKSQCDILEKYSLDGDNIEITVEIPEWLAHSNELI